METIATEYVPTPEEVAALQSAQQSWSTGNQSAAIEAVRPFADADRPWAAALLAWFFMQQGAPGIGESVTWAVKAAQLGLPGQTIHTFNNAIGQVAADPALAARLPELLAWGMPWANGVDLVGQGFSLSAQGLPELGLQVMMLPFPVPVTGPQWKGLVAQARKYTSSLREIEAAALAQQLELNEYVGKAQEAIDRSRSELETSAGQAGLLVTTVLSDATNSLYKADAARNTKESRGAWNLGLGVLAVAAFVAVLPVVLHYLRLGPIYSALEQIALHLTSTIALATFAGVLLARSRARDHAAQRANDLSTAMGTMIAYSSQIADPAERQRFMATMGQVVLQAQLSSGSRKGTKDDSSVDLIALAALLKPTLASASTPPTS